MSNFEVGESSGNSVSTIDRPLPTYGDSGDCVCVCCHCNAEFWWVERIIRGSTRANPLYSQCCKQGDVYCLYP